MNIEKRIKAEKLLYTIGEIDDSLLEEAIAYRPRKRIRSRILVLAATVAVIFTVAVGSALISSIVNSFDKEEAIPEQEAPTVPPTIDSLLEGARDGEKFDYVSLESDLPYIDSSAHIVWQYSGDDGYYVSDALTDSELDRLIYQLGSGEEVGADSPRIECMVWVLLGDGRVISPYLKASAGNISNGIFDYEAEIVPNESIVWTISGILS